MASKNEITTLILCGGRGTRAYPHTLELPKPLLDVHGTPVLAHVMEIYALQGFRRFVLAAGYRADMITAFVNTRSASEDVVVVDTGPETDKADRILMCRDELTETFFVTYGDGLGAVDLADLLAFHRSHPGFATVTVVPLPSQYGTLQLDVDGRVAAFSEKPVLADHWINAGFFVMDQGVFDHWAGPDLEGDVLPAIVRGGGLYAYQHVGFWKSMDTYKDSIDLTELAKTSSEKGEAPPWIRSGTHESS